MIADTLEQAGHTTMLQAWDLRPGESFRVSVMLRAPDMQEGLNQTIRSMVGPI